MTSILCSVAVVLTGAALARFGGPRCRVAGLSSLVVALVLDATVPSGHGAWSTDALSLVLAIAAVLIGVSAGAYGLRQFRGEVRAASITMWVVLVVGSVCWLDVARSMAAIVCSWLVTSLATVGVLATSAGVGRLQAGRRALWSVVVGDGALLVAVGAAAVLHAHHLRGAGVVVVVGAGLAALARAGFGPRRSWVVSTVAAPTPVSALLHAGVVNAGAVLLLHISGHRGLPTWFAVGLLVASVVQMVILAPEINRRFDLKGQLATSTVSQMAFMFACIALGWPVLAVTHLIGHGIYKAGRFMGAGGAIGERAHLRAIARTGLRPTMPRRLTGAAVIAGAGFSASVVLGGEVRTAMPIFAAAALALWRQRTSRPTAHPVATAAVLACVLAGYGAVVALAAALLASSMPAVTWQAPWWSAVAVVGLVALSVVRPRRTPTPAQAIVPSTQVPAAARAVKVAP